MLNSDVFTRPRITHSDEKNSDEVIVPGRVLGKLTDAYRNKRNRRKTFHVLEGSH